LYASATSGGSIGNPGIYAYDEGSKQFFMFFSTPNVYRWHNWVDLGNFVVISNADSPCKTVLVMNVSTGEVQSFTFGTESYGYQLGAMTSKIAFLYKRSAYSVKMLALDLSDGSLREVSPVASGFWGDWMQDGETVCVSTSTSQSTTGLYWWNETGGRFDRIYETGWGWGGDDGMTGVRLWVGINGNLLVSSYSNGDGLLHVSPNGVATNLAPGTSSRRSQGMRVVGDYAYAVCGKGLARVSRDGVVEIVYALSYVSYDSISWFECSGKLYLTFSGRYGMLRVDPDGTVTVVSTTAHGSVHAAVEFNGEMYLFLNSFGICKMDADDNLTSVLEGININPSFTTVFERKLYYMVSARIMFVDEDDAITTVQEGINVSVDPVEKDGELYLVAGDYNSTAGGIWKLDRAAGVFRQVTRIGYRYSPVDVATGHVWLSDVSTRQLPKYNAGFELTALQSGMLVKGYTVNVHGLMSNSGNVSHKVFLPVFLLKSPLAYLVDEDESYFFVTDGSIVYSV
jgi:hypothetical protein